MRLILNKRELQELALWGSVYKTKTEEVGMKFEEDQIRLLEKIEKLKKPKGKEGT
jgi:hypothetical protein